MNKSVADVPAKLVDDFPRLPGDFVWRPTREEPSRILFCCPCGCESIIGVNVKPEEQLGVVKHPWQWNGNRERPTLTPSIRVVGCCEWHGYLTDGVFKTC